MLAEPPFRGVARELDAAEAHAMRVLARSQVFHRRPLCTIGALTALSAVASLLASLLCSHLVWNSTASLPRGLYWVTRKTCNLGYGEIAVLPIPPAVRPLVLERGYVPPGYVLLKPVVALAGDTVCIRADVALVNDHPVGPVLHTDLEGRELPVDTLCGPLRPGLVYLASTHHPRSFDSRNFGPVSIATIQGKASPLWTF